MSTTHGSRKFSKVKTQILQKKDSNTDSSRKKLNTEQRKKSIKINSVCKKINKIGQTLLKLRKRDLLISDRKDGTVETQRIRNTATHIYTTAIGHVRRNG